MNVGPYVSITYPTMLFCNTFDLRIYVCILRTWNMYSILMHFNELYDIQMSNMFTTHIHMERNSFEARQ